MNKPFIKEQTKSFPLVGVQPSDIATTLILVMLAIATPTIFAHAPHNQLITGTIVNGLLIWGAWRLGLANALFVAAVPSTIALIQGLLPAPFALMIPYIIAANSLLVIVFSALRKTPLIGIATASLAKFGFLFIVSSFYATKIGPSILLMFQWPQLVTALLGGIGAYLTYRMVK